MEKSESGIRDKHPGSATLTEIHRILLCPKVGVAIYRRFCGARRRRGTGATPPRHLYQAPVGAPQVGKFHESEVTVQRTSEHF